MMVAVLHDIRSSHNAGSIFRTADGAGVGKLYLCGTTPGPKDRFGRENANLTKVSLGAEKSVAWEYAKSSKEIILRLKEEGFKILALEQDPRSKSVYRAKIEPKEKYALVLGNEISGLPGQILDICDEVIEIPLRGNKESLNVAVAFGAAAFLLLRPAGQW